MPRRVPVASKIRDTRLLPQLLPKGSSSAAAGREVCLDQRVTMDNHRPGRLKYRKVSYVTLGGDSFVHLIGRGRIQIKTFTNGEKKGNLDIEIAIDMLELADKIDRAILFSGDGDFAPLLKKVGMKGVRTQVVSYGSRGEGPTASELLDSTDIFTDLQDIIHLIVKK